MQSATLSFEEQKKHLITRSAWLIVIIFALNYGAMLFFWYSTIWWFDMPMHFLGGFWLGLTALWIYFYARKTPRVGVTAMKTLLLGLSFVLIVGVGWEIFEIGVDRFITLMPFNRLDTASDIFFDLAGGSVAVLYMMRRGYVRVD